MRLDLIATCNAGDCPSIFDVAGTTDVVVQGYPLTSSAAGVTVPEGESLVRIPRSVLLEAARRWVSVT